MDRQDAARLVIEAAGAEALIVSSLGTPSYDLAGAADRDRTFYLWGSMGLAPSVGLGLALARPDDRVIVVDGDASLLMNLGALTTVGWQAPANLVWVVIDNGLFQITGGQSTATSVRADLSAMAIGAGIDRARTVADLESFREAVTAARREPGPHFIAAKVTGPGSTARPPLDPVYLKHRFQAAIGTDAPGAITRRPPAEP